MSAFLRWCCWTRSDSNTPVSRISNIKVCEFESLIRGQDKILLTKESALAKSFLLKSLVSESIWYVGFCSVWYFGRSCLITVWEFNLLLLYTDGGTRTNCSLSRQMVNDGRSHEFYFNRSGMPERPVIFLERAIRFCFEILSDVVF